MSENKSKPSQRFHSLNAEQVEVLHQVLSEVVPIHGRGNFPTLELRPRDIIIAVRARLQKQGITVRDVRLNGSTASHVLVRDNGTSYKDLDIIFGVEMPSQEEFQVIKESVLGCLLDCLPAGVNRERISSATMKEAYVQKMVKVFNEYDRWSLISLSNNSGKNLELKFVSMLRRQFEFSVDSFQIILDRLLESYLQQESQHKVNTVDGKDKPAENHNKDSPSLPKKTTETEESTGRDSSSQHGTQFSQTQKGNEVHDKESKLSQATVQSKQTKHSKVEDDNKDKIPADTKEDSAHRENLSETILSDQTSPNPLSEKKQTSEKAEPSTPTDLEHKPQLTDKSKHSTKVEQPQTSQSCDGREPALSNLNELSTNEEQAESKTLVEQKEPAQYKQLKTSNKTQTESLKQAEGKHCTDLSKSFSNDQRSNEKDKTQHASAPDLSASSQEKIEIQLVDERKVEIKIGEQAERENDIEVNEETGENLESQARNIEDKQCIDCSCSTSSVYLTLHITQPPGTPDSLEIPSTLQTDNSDKTPIELDTVNPPDTQDILAAPTGLASDKKTSSPPFCKASERLSHMVVLKHSSPKPPRRMCRKVAPSHCTSPVCETEPAIASCLGPDLSPSLEPQILSNPDLTSTPSTSVSPETNPAPEPNPSSMLASNLDFASTFDSDPDIACDSAVDPVSGLSQEPSFSQLIIESSLETSIIISSSKETQFTHVAIDERIQSSPMEAVPGPEQSEALESEETLTTHTDKASVKTQQPDHISEIEASDQDQNREQSSKTLDLHQPNSSKQDTTLNSHSSYQCVTPPVLSLSPPCLIPSPPSFSPPPCQTPPHCLSSPVLSNVSPATSFNSQTLSFSPTSSCLCTPPYLTPPMLSLSPPPLFLTPPVETEDLVPQVSSDMEPLIPNADEKEYFQNSSPDSEISNLQLVDLKEQDYISSLPQVAEPISFPITVPSSSSRVLPLSQCGTPGESTPPKADEASSSVPEKEVPKVTTDMPKQSNSPQTSSLVPAVEVLAESMYGDFEAAMDHLRYRLIATRNPEEIRGGGLLKYSNLLVRDYRPASETQIKTLERYMCSRFFIDFPDVQEQQRKILSYLKNHFIGEERSKYQYLMTLRRVVDDSTVCLMGHERRQTLNMITVLALKVLGEQNIIPNTDHVTCFYQPAPYLAEHSAPFLEPSYCGYYIPQGGSTLLYQPYPLHLNTQTGLV